MVEVVQQVLEQQRWLEQLEVLEVVVEVMVQTQQQVERVIHLT